MLRTLTGAGLVLSLTACQYNALGVFLAELPLAADLDCDTTISENITDSDPPDATTTPGTTDWVYTDEAVVSNSLMLIQIFEDKQGRVIVDFGGALFPGEKDGKTIVARWENADKGSYSEENATAGYRYSEVDDTTVLNEMTFTKDKEIKGYKVDWTTTTTTVARYEETDEWTTPDGPYAGLINTWIFTYLTGTGSNSPDMVDCDSDPCFVDINATCRGSVVFDAVETNLDHEDFTAVEGDGQPFGVSIY